MDLSKIDVAETLRLLDRADCEESLYHFLKCAWPHFDPAPWVDGWCLEAIAEHLQAVCDGEIKRLIVNIPPRHGKTNIISAAFPAWVWAQSNRGHTSGPGVRFLCTTYGLKLSRDGSDRCRRIIKSEWYQSLFGDRFQLRKDKDGIDEFANDKGGERIIRSVGSGVTGIGGDIIVADDPNEASDENSELSREGVIQWWEGTMATRLNNQKKGAIVGVQQRIAEDDWTGHQLAKDADGWVHLMLPARYESDRSFVTAIGWKDPRTRDGELLWPERFGEEELTGLEKIMGKFKSAGQLQQRPEPAGGGIIKREWWKLWEEPKFPPCDFILASVDTAYTEKTQNDPSAMTVWGVFHHDGKSYPNMFLSEDGRPQYLDRGPMMHAPKVVLLHAWTERLELHELVKKVAQTCQKYLVDRLLVEAKASGISVSQELRRLYSHQNWGVTLINPGNLDKVARLYSIQHIFENEQVYAPDLDWADKVITQVGQFPKGKHDDLVDTTSMAMRWLRDQGMLTFSEERQVELDESMRFTGNHNNAPLYPG